MTYHIDIPKLETAVRRLLQVVGDQRPGWLDGWEIPLLEQWVDDIEKNYLRQVHGQNVTIGDWCLLQNGWVVGPVVSAEQGAVYVAFGDGTWQLELEDESAPRFVVASGVREALP